MHESDEQCMVHLAGDRAASENWPRAGTGVFAAVSGGHLHQPFKCVQPQTGRLMTYRKHRKAFQVRCAEMGRSLYLLGKHRGAIEADSPYYTLFVPALLAC